MSQAAEILTELQQRGVIVAVEGDTLILKPKSALDDTLLARVRQAKPAILEALRNRPTTCSPDCYEVEAGVWIHRPWTGCTTIKPESVAPHRKVPPHAGIAAVRRNVGVPPAGREARGIASPAKGPGKDGGGFNDEAQ